MNSILGSYRPPPSRTIYVSQFLVINTEALGRSLFDSPNRVHSVVRNLGLDVPVVVGTQQCPLSINQIPLFPERPLVVAYSQSYLEMIAKQHEPLRVIFHMWGLIALAYRQYVLLTGQIKSDEYLLAGLLPNFGFDSEFEQIVKQYQSENWCPDRTLFSLDAVFVSRYVSVLVQQESFWKLDHALNTILRLVTEAKRSNWEKYINLQYRMRLRPCTYSRFL